MHGSVKNYAQEWIRYKKRPVDKRALFVEYMNMKRLEVAFADASIAG
jgi:hypothetical protein